MKTINNKQYEECSLVMLATDKAENCLIIRGSKLETYKQYFTQIYLKNLGITSYHLYILSNDEIKEGDWMLHPNKGFKVGDIWNSYINPIKAESHWFPIVPSNKAGIHGFKKIIVTTDKSLFNHHINEKNPSKTQIYLSQIPQSFIDYFVEQYNDGNVIDKVLVEYDGSFGCSDSDSRQAPIINSDNTINILTQKDSWSKEEVVELLLALSSFKGDQDDYEEVNEWISKNL